MDERLTTMEERVAWLEFRLAETQELLDAACRRVDGLEAEVKRLREETAGPAEDPPDWEVPPHY